jgi:DNA-binding transcriptional LysR family regulator
LPGALAAFRRRHASIDVIVFEGSDQEVDMWIRTRAVDVGVVMLPARGLETTELTSDEMVALVPAGHRYADRNHVRLRDLSSDPFIMSKGGCEPLIRDLYRASGAELDVHHEVREVPTIVAMVQEGLGVTIVPTLSLPPRVRGVRALRLVPAARRRLAFALLSPGEAPPATKTFVVETQAWARQRFASDAHGRRALLPRP